MGHKILTYVLEEAGFKVVPLGVQCSPEELIAAAIETKADAILISSMAGHGEVHCREFREKCIEAGLEEIILYAGGNLVVGSLPWEYTEKVFKEMGFNRVYPPGVDLDQVIKDLKKDLDVEEVEEVEKGTEI